MVTITASSTEYCTVELVIKWCGFMFIMLRSKKNVRSLPTCRRSHFIIKYSTTASILLTFRVSMQVAIVGRFTSVHSTNIPRQHSWK